MPESAVPRTRWPVAAEWFDVIVSALAVAFCFRAYYYQPFQIPTGSMQPTLYGIHAAEADAPSAWDKGPLRFLKWCATGERYQEVRVRAPGIVSAYGPSEKPGYGTVLVNGRDRYDLPSDVALGLRQTLPPGSRVAMNQLKGGFKDRINMLRDKLKDIQSLLELELDFSDHDDLDFAERPVLISKAEDIQKEIQSLLHSFTSMNAVKNGVPVAITGKTNVGKSTLMNALLSDSRAIVSNIPGTTRDTIEERIIIKGIEFRLIDTAGIRKTDDVIENLGIDKTFKVIDTAQIIIWVVSAPEVLENDMKDATDELGTILESGKTLITVINKADIIPDKSSLEKIESRLSAYIRSIIKTTSQENPDKETEPVFVITSAKKRAGIDQLEDTLVKVINNSKTNSSDSIVINERHYQALSKASKNMDDVISGLKNLMPADLVSQDLREMLLNLSTISGEITSQEILNNIFSHFCIGK